MAAYPSLLCRKFHTPYLRQAIEIAKDLNMSKQTAKKRKKSDRLMKLRFSIENGGYLLFSGGYIRDIGIETLSSQLEFLDSRVSIEVSQLEYLNRSVSTGVSQWEYLN